MWDFAKAAFPWVAMGIALILLTVRYDKSKKASAQAQEEQTPDKEQPNYMTEGMCIGMCLGAGLGALRGCNVGSSISIGMLLGLAIGTQIQKR